LVQEPVRDRCIEAHGVEVPEIARGILWRVQIHLTLQPKLSKLLRVQLRVSSKRAGLGSTICSATQSVWRCSDHPERESLALNTLEEAGRAAVVREATVLSGDHTQSTRPFTIVRDTWNSSID
jgi:hypothetical protein